MKHDRFPLDSTRLLLNQIVLKDSTNEIKIVRNYQIMRKINSEIEQSLIRKMCFLELSRNFSLKENEPWTSAPLDCFWSYLAFFLGFDEINFSE